MKLSIFLTLSLFAYSSVQAARGNPDLYGHYSPPGVSVPKHIYDQQKKEEDYWKIVQLHKRFKELELEANKCDSIIHVRRQQLKEKYHPSLKKHRWQALADLIYCYKIAEEKEIVEEKLYEKKNER